MNKLILTGRLTRDAEIKFAKTGTSIIEFDIANNTGYGEYKKTCFIGCTIFKRDKLVDHLKKGKGVIVEGELQQDNWEKDGKKFSKHKMIVAQLEFLGEKKGSETEETHTDDDIPF